jgi:prolyl-tRNA synthetase
MTQAQKARKITPRAQDYSEWYNDVIMQAELADYSPVRGCMVIRPHGYRIWELMQGALDAMFKATGHKNAYFPLFIPQSFLAKEAEHVEGFAKEVALVTHTRLKATGKTGAEAVMPDPASALEEPLVVRPTSETIIYAMFAKWIQSYRDLPLLLNQWANVVRWELRTRLFLRTTEFLWQEGHTAHATEGEAEAEARKILGIYRVFQEQWMAMPVITGVKTDREKFAGALRTYALEALMQDNKALQAGTSHHLGQNFARAFNVQYQTAAGGLEYVWNTSWGVTTRMIGALIMTHSDDNGLVAPPKLAPVQVVIVPIWKSEDEKARVADVSSSLHADLAAAGVRVELDLRDTMKPGAKYFEWEAKGVPLRLEIGPRDVSQGQVTAARRGASRETGKTALPLDGRLVAAIGTVLTDIQAALFSAARERRDANTIRGATRQQFLERMTGAGGFVYAAFCGSAACEDQIKAETGATVRVLPDPEFRSPELSKTCMWCGAPSVAEALWAQAY